eukprot:695698-Alexandrium_andersonii.AAC.1
MHEPPYGKRGHAWGSQTHRVLVCGGHAMNAYSGARNQTIISRIRNNVYGWQAGGPADCIEFLGGANCGYCEWLEAL